MKMYSSSLIREIKVFRANSELIKQSIYRDFIGRYKGSILGVAWAFFMPLVLLAVYTFVFSVIFNAKWGTGAGQSKLDFALILFIGMIIYNFFSEILTRSPVLIIQNVNFVKKVVYPLEIIPFVAVSTAFFNMLISFFIWECAYLMIKQEPNLTIVYLPLVIMPLIIGMLGASLFLSSLGTYIRDVSQVTGVLATVFMFLSPIFFSIDTLPEEFRIFMLFNPLTYFIEESRSILFFGERPDFLISGIHLLGSLVFLKLGFVWFQKTRYGFSDVI